MSTAPVVSTALAHNVDVGEIGKFSDLAHSWWDLDGPFKPLHQINPLRLGLVQRHVQLDQARVLDVGCGGGILSESMARAGAQVVGIDMAEKSLKVARLHALEHDVPLEYRLQSVEDLAAAAPASFDVVTCMEMLEHVPSPDSIIAACARLVKPGGHVFFSTINRTPKAWLLAIVGAEYVLGWLPRGTHEYSRFLKPAEIALTARGEGLHLQEICGMSYNPLNTQYSLSGDTDVNYLMVWQKGMC